MPKTLGKRREYSLSISRHDIAIIALTTVVVFFSDDSCAANTCIRPNTKEKRAIRLSFERTLLPDLTGEPAAGPLFEPCILRHSQHGRYVLLDFSVEGFYGGNNWGQFLALGRFDEQRQIVWIAGGPTGGNAPPPFQVNAVRSGKEIWIEWHDAKCVTLSYRGLAVPIGANSAFPNPGWKKASITLLHCGHCSEDSSTSCIRIVTSNGSPSGERIAN